MNVHAISQSIPSINTITARQEMGMVHQFPREISLRIRTLNILSHRVLGEAAPLFCKIIYYLDQPKSTISYKRCEELFEQAFIQEFSSDEIDLFLKTFFQKFDPDEEFISYQNLNEKGKAFLWEGIIKYYCHHYIDFQTETYSLETLFNQIEEKYDPDHNVIKKQEGVSERRLEKHFDLAMDIIPQFSVDELIEMKLLLISYCALLITSLQKVEETRDFNLILDNGFTIQDLFEEIFILMLELPFLPALDSEGISRLQEKLDELAPEALKERFLTGLIQYLLDSQDSSYEKNAKAIREVMGECFFLDFEYKDFLQNISQETDTPNQLKERRTRIYVDEQFNS